MKRHKLRIDVEHAKQLLQGKPIAFKVPPETEVLQISLNFKVSSSPSVLDSLAKICDVFFNGRRA